MTLLIRRRTLVLLLCFAIGTALVPAAMSFGMLRGAVELSPAEAKAAAERALFVGIVAVSILLAMLVVTLVSVQRLGAALSRLADLNRAGGYDVEPALKRLGDVGDSITRIYRQLVELSARKSTRISAMSSLLNVVLAQSPQKLLVVDPRGSIVRATPAALKFLETTSGDALGKPVDSLIPDVKFARARAAIGRTGDSWAAEQSSFPVAVQPVLNDRDDIGYFVYYLGPEARLIVRTDPGRDQPAAAAPEDPALPPALQRSRQKGSVLSGLRRLLGGKPPAGR